MTDAIMDKALRDAEHIAHTLPMNTPHTRGERERIARTIRAITTELRRLREDAA